MLTMLKLILASEPCLFTIPDSEKFTWVREPSLGTAPTKTVIDMTYDFQMYEELEA